MQALAAAVECEEAGGSLAHAAFAVTALRTGPEMVRVMGVLGRQRVLQRLHGALQHGG